MKTAIPWVLVAALLAGIYFVYADSKKKDIEIARLTLDSQQLAGVKTENDALSKKIPMQNEELARLRKEHDEVLRLRSSVQHLNDDIKRLNTQLTGAQAQATQAKQAQQQAAQQVQAQADQAGAEAKLAVAQAATCVGFLRQIDGAKQQWALEFKKTPDAVPTPDELTPYLQNPAQILCPGGGVYSINAVSVLPTCNIPGHSMAQAK